MSTYKTIHTNYGLARTAQAIIDQTQINITHMAIGDGAGADVVVAATSTALVREVYRTTVNRVYRDPADPPGMFTAEGVVPSGTGGFVMREVGIFDSNGYLYCYGNLPAVYKPELAEGSQADAFVRVKFAVAEASVITLQIDPNVAVASHSWVLNAITPALLLPGGTTGQVLSKVSNANGDVHWSDPTVANVIVNTIEELQTLVSGQTVVNLTLTTTNGLALYIDGERVPASEWVPDPVIDNKLTLNTGLSGSHELIAVQNEGAGNTPVPLQRALNLADVPNKATARTNLDVFSKAESRQLSPAGMFSYFIRTTAPTGWLKANGAAISRTAYADLFAAIGTIYGPGDGANTFNLPDLRGEFIRGFDDNRGLDPDRGLGSTQAGSMQSHNHAASSDGRGGHNHDATTSTAGNHVHNAGAAMNGSHTHEYRDRYFAENLVRLNQIGGVTHKELLPAGYNNRAGGYASDADNDYSLYLDSVTAAGGTHSHTIEVYGAGNHNHTVTLQGVPDHAHTITVGNTGGTENRPRNVALLACIKY
jgi:microcystin-dependent protein